MISVSKNHFSITIPAYPGARFSLVGADLHIEGANKDLRAIVTHLRLILERKLEPAAEAEEKRQEARASFEQAEKEKAAADSLQDMIAKGIPQVIDPKEAELKRIEALIPADGTATAGLGLGAPPSQPEAETQPLGMHPSAYLPQQPSAPALTAEQITKAVAEGMKGTVTKPHRTRNGRSCADCGMVFNKDNMSSACVPPQQKTNG